MMSCVHLRVPLIFMSFKHNIEMIYSMLSAIKFLSCIDIDVLQKNAIQIFFMCIIVGSRAKKHDRNGTRKNETHWFKKCSMS